MRGKIYFIKYTLCIEEFFQELPVLPLDLDGRAVVFAFIGLSLNTTPSTTFSQSLRWRCDSSDFVFESKTDKY